MYDLWLEDKHAIGWGTQKGKARSWRGLKKGEGYRHAGKTACSDETIVGMGESNTPTLPCSRHGALTLYSRISIKYRERVWFIQRDLLKLGDLRGRFRGLSQRTTSLA